MSEDQTPNERQALKTYWLGADERDVYHALPRHVAHALDLPHDRTLALLVDALFRGEALLHWELECPVCRFRSEEPQWLQRAQHDYTCPACGETYDVHLDDEAQVTFSPHTRLRELSPAADDEEFQRQVRQQFMPTTAHELLAVQRFRDWARNEPLPVGEYLEIRHMTVWFSDLTGSTALYARNGDPRAYGLVREHFDLVFGVVNRHGGAVVKTMGDGIMAVFTRSAPALEAALAAHATLDAFNRQRALYHDRRLALKIGVHAGPSIMVTLNDRLDYFGTTVNVAARVSDLAQGGQTLFTRSVYTSPEIQTLLAQHTLEALESEIRGLDQAMTVYRLVVPGVDEDSF
jgi:class 3 adenylate cyclase